MGRDSTFRLAFAGCAHHSIGSFTKLACAKFLYQGGQEIVFSVEDYGNAIVEPRLRLQPDGKQAVAIRLG